MAGPSQPQVFDETWSDERVRGFLAPGPAEDDMDTDYRLLLRAYQAMRAEDFARFVRFFREDGRNLQACGPDGRPFRERLAGHRHAAPYLAALEAEAAA